MEEVESRFLHLLQPIRDLTKNWEVDVAAQLGEYLEEVRGGSRNSSLGEKLAGEWWGMEFNQWLLTAVSPRARCWGQFCLMPLSTIWMRR
uniref:Condensin-2 complex subunit H2 n=1 Tax=Calidris pygmaea TaxID=425635 RepID=A0A8C3K0A1_9CHAR